MKTAEYKVNQKLTYSAYNIDTGKDMFGKGWFKYVENEKVWLQTTKGLIWVEHDAILKSK